MLGRSLGLWCLLVLGARRQPGARGQPRMVVGTSRPRRVELLVVVDVGLAYALDGEVRPYVLALLDAADRLYRHPSLGSAIRLVVSRLEVVWDQARGPRVVSDASQTLHAFCRWQQERRALGDWGEAPYDAALLLTRENLCQENFCESLGLGHIGTVCEADSGQNCAVVQDIGLQSAFTIAHEIGHLLGMAHDNSEICVQMGAVSSGHQMMSPMLSRVDFIAPWSLCSFRLSLGFFASGRGDCLLNEPSVSLAESVPLAGTNYDRDFQCRLSFGPEFRARPGLDPCPVLWCLARHQGEWQHLSKQLPAADGTPCGVGAVCLRGKCAANWKQLTPVDGSWGSWGPWRTCSRSCGGGVQYSRRRCDNPTPINFGHFCLGRWERFQSCNLESCPGDNGGSFRQEQCAARNGPSEDGTIQEWDPYFHGIRWPDLCKLNCLLKGTDLVTIFSTKVRDGTRCYPHSDAVCVRSQCVRTGCEAVIGSRKRYSRCGVCGGSDTDCERVINHFRGKVGNYTEVVVIPRRAAGLKVQQLLRRGQSRLSAYLAVRREDGSYAVNGGERVTVFPSLIQAGGVSLQYTGWGPRRDRLEALTHRPLTHAIHLHVYRPRGRGVVRLTYSYYRLRQGAKPTGAPGPDPGVPRPYPTLVPSPNPTLVPGPNPALVTSPNPALVPGPNPTLVPSVNPTLVPGPNPTLVPGPNPALVPGPNPALVPSVNPALVPGPNPALVTSPNPALVPGPNPTLVPSVNPALEPGPNPALVTGPNPALVPGPNPTLVPSVNPALVPGPNPALVTSPNPALVPGPNPALVPGPNPALVPGPNPALVPGPNPTLVPGPNPALVPGPNPALVPGPNPTLVPGPNPALVPNPNPALVPGIDPTPVATPLPTPIPTLDPTLVSSPAPSQDHGGVSSPDPTLVPTPAPTPIATLAPTADPSPVPSRGTSPEHTSPLPPAPTPGGALATTLVCWWTGPWQLCSVSCGVGWVARRVRCVDGAGKPAQGCIPEQQPLGMALCVRGACQEIGRLRPKVKLTPYRPITHSRSKG